MRFRSRLGFGATLLAVMLALPSLALPSVAEAQAWLSDRARTEGPGFRLGDFELHPGIGVEIGYDSNLFLSSGTVRSPIVDTGVLRATAHLLFSTRGEQRRTEGEAGGGEGQAPALPAITFRGGLSGTFYHWFARPERANMGVDASLALGILPGRPFSIDIVEEFGRNVRPFTANTSVFADWGRIQNNAGVDLNFATTGNVLKITTGYRFGLDFFENALFQYGNSFRHTVTLSETFRFLPQTAIVQDNSFVYNDFYNPRPTAPTLVNDGFLLRSRVGMNGAFTSEFSVLAMVGYAAGFFDTALTGYDQEYESLIAQIEARWRIVPQARLVFGYDRDFQPSFLGNFFRRDRGYANFQTTIGGAFLLGVEASVGYYEFGAIVDPTGTMAGSSLQRGDIRLIASLFAEYRFTEWLGVNGTITYTGNFTDFTYDVLDGMGGTLLEPAGFNKFEASLGARVFY